MIIITDLKQQGLILFNGFQTFLYEFLRRKFCSSWRFIYVCLSGNTVYSLILR